VSKVLQIAAREFVATVFTRAFIIGLLVLPAMMAVGFLVGPRLFSDRDFRVQGQVEVIDPTGQVVGALRSAVTGNRPGGLDTLLGSGASGANPQDIAAALAAPPNLTIVERPENSDLDTEKTWLTMQDTEAPHLALAVIHGNAVEPRPGESELGSYDLYVPQRQDSRIETAIQRSLRDAVVSARLSARNLDRATIDALVNVPRVRSVAVGEGGERGVAGAFNFVLPIAFMFLLFMGVMGSGQGLLTTTIEEKASRVVEVLLSAVSPMQLMAGKLIGHMGISLLAMSLYLALGLLALSSFSLFGLLEPSLIAYLFVFYLLAFFTVGSLMMAIGSAVNEMREAQSLMMPITLLLIAPWFLWMPISRNPNSVFAIVTSFAPPVNSFAMLLRLASTDPPPAWQVWVSIALGVLGVAGATWVAAKVFRIGLLMFGKPPDFATLLRWVRSA
jgi:ABC-2 type transport system permease protein